VIGNGKLFASPQLRPFSGSSVPTFYNDPCVWRPRLAATKL
jgi:hypothetical protein